MKRNERKWRTAFAIDSAKMLETMLPALYRFVSHGIRNKSARPISGYLICANNLLSTRLPVVHYSDARSFQSGKSFSASRKKEREREDVLPFKNKNDTPDTV